MNALKKQRVLPAILLCSAAIVTGWWAQKPRVSEQDKQYYASLLCALVAREHRAVPSAQLRKEISQAVEQGNNDYALSRRDFNDAAASMVLDRWQQLRPEIQQQLRQQQEHCQQQLTQGEN
ncbi:hypothetical protein BL250_05580 [Erwinia sp. OLTSP20]|uniref:hypothetical protein n=1 Tax=unclassified Erwinia TaxID=2622719 RepID=UPI000C19C64D|nr:MULTISPECIES: hypothetical protein [unclassified Erwinia]PIJ51138.1 hypothetical protein BV501_05040 [Erwinia sp. OAMSP11]PIJ73890.1 hypothetical protein BK416_05315 [Erwinia sp. OLSSP12]PIJ83898.1 hypothetical protein BLD47_02940 [Erwinia sp. OLCASP19]PIJ86428.1 hypothetical protein BLD46_03220 [Erwinia sp. OLMTSP26]PIJ87907.1 hypothetical protein BLD49_03900 [Erwinia sp. OLMDSP33]